MKGWLLVNGFLYSSAQSEKFAELYGYLQNAAKGCGVELEIRYTSDVLCDLQNDEQLQGKPDFVLFWDKDVLAAKRLERLHIPVFNSASAVEICDNKMLTALALTENKVKTPKTFFLPKTFEGVGYPDTAFLDKAEQALGYPMVFKQAYGSFGKQVYLVENRTRLEELARTFAGKDCLLQEFIRTSYGRDVRVNVVGGKVVCCMLRENANDFRSNVTGGGRATRFTPSFAQEMAAIAACEAVGADFAGVDILFGKMGEPIVCEVNSNPHFKSSIDATGVDVSEYIMRYVVERVCKGC